MNNIKNQISNIACSYHIGRSEVEKEKIIQVTEKTAIEISEDDANDKKIICSVLKISKARKYLSDIYEELKKTNGFLVEFFALIFGITLSQLMSLWASINMHSTIAIISYIFLTICCSVSVCFWIFLRKEKISTHEKLKIILEDFLPDTTKTTPLKEE